MKKEMAVIDANGSLVDVEVISVFNLEETGNNYAVYTFNDKDDNGLVKIYVSRFIENSGTYNFNYIESDDEWNRVKNVLKIMARSEQ